MGTKPENSSSFRPEHGSNAFNPLLPAILAVVILCSILTTVFTAARLIMKRLSSTYDLNDYMLMLAWVAVVTFEFVLFAAGFAGLGRHARHIDKVMLDKYVWALEILYLPAIWLAKASLLFQMIQIFASTKSGPLYWACHTLIWGNLAFYISILLPIIFECHPIWSFWNPHYEYHCIDWKRLLVVSSAVNISSGLLILLLAVWAILQLPVAHRMKSGVIAIFATGSLAFIASICRLVYTRHLTSSHDVSYIIAQTMLWGLTEITTTILCTIFLTIPQSLQSFRTRYPPRPRATKPPLPTPSPSPLKAIRKSKIFKIGNVQSSTFINNYNNTSSHSGGGRGPARHHHQDVAVDMEFLKSPYRYLGDENEEECVSVSECGMSVVRDLNSKKSVGVQIAERHGLGNMKSCRASIV